MRSRADPAGWDAPPPDPRPGTRHRADPMAALAGSSARDAAAIKSLPSAQYLAAAARGSGAYRECAVCLLELTDGDELRVLPLCAHAFHADCIDVWLCAHASCPLCRARALACAPTSSAMGGAAAGAAGA